MKKYLSILLAGAMALSIAGCNSAKKDEVKPTEAAKEEAVSDVDTITKKGKIIVGITDYEPMDFKGEDGEWTGFDAEFAQAFAKELGVEVEFLEIDWDNKFLELDSKAIDCIWNGMTITDEVTKNTSCSNAYAKNEQIIVMKADKVGDYKDVDSMKDLTFAVESGSSAEGAAEEAGLKTVAVAAQTDTLMEVESGSADGAIIDSTMAAAMTGEGTSYADLKSGLSISKEEYGVGFRKKSDLTEKFNEFLKKSMSDGSLKALSDKYEVALVD